MDISSQRPTDGEAPREDESPQPIAIRKLDRLETTSPSSPDS